MRILVVSQYFWPETFRVNEIVEHLCAKGHDVTVLTGPPNYPAGNIFPEYLADPAGFSSYAGARIVRIPCVPRGQSSLRLIINYLTFALSGATAGAWRLRKEAFDAILVFQVSPVTAAIPALVQRRLKGVPVSMWILDLWPETLKAVGVLRNERGLALVGRLVSAIYRRCDHILVQSQAFVPSVKRHGGEGADVRYFPAWVEGVFEDTASRAEVAPELAPYRDGFNVLFAGNIGEAQDFPAILAAADRLRERRDINWIVLGDGRAAEGVRGEITARGLGDRVFMLGRFPVERMPSFFAGAGALLVSLKSEPVFAMTIPGKVQSYMSAGKPIIAMLDGEGGRVVTEAGAGLVVASGDSAGLADAVARLAGLGDGERRAMGAAGKAYCGRNFDRAVLLGRLESWLAELRDRRAASARH